MSGRPRFRSRVLLLVALLLTTTVQLPTVVWLCVLTHSPWPAVFAAVVSLPYVIRMGNPWQSAGLVPKLALGWWSACLVFALLLGPVSLAVRLGAPAAGTWGVAGAVALGLGVRAVLGGPRLRQFAVRVAGLPSELDGYRIGQISDVHCGPNTPEHRVSTWVSRLNALDLDLMTVTGDLITHGDAYVEPVARALGGLRAKDGVFACMGNHDYFTEGDQLVGALERAGLQVLRNRGVVVSRGGGRLYVAGVDDTWTSRDDMPRALESLPRACPRCCSRMIRISSPRPTRSAWSSPSRATRTAGSSPCRACAASRWRGSSPAGPWGSTSRAARGCT